LSRRENEAKMLQLPTLLWKEYKIQICITAVIVGVLYIASLSDAIMNPWTLWRQEWRQDSRADQRRIASYQTQKVCIEEQWKKLREQLESNTIIAKKTTSVLNFRRVTIQEGATIFEFKKTVLFEKRTSTPAGMQNRDCRHHKLFLCADIQSIWSMAISHTYLYYTIALHLTR
jgi:hypothetical protein